MNIKKRILLVGNIKGAYRSQILIKSLINYRAEGGYEVSFISDAFYTPRAVSKKLGSRIFLKIRKFFIVIISLLELMAKIPFCDLIYILPMNHEWMPKVYLLNLLWRKPTITDLYISIYDTGLDRKWYVSNSKIKGIYYKLKRAEYHRFLDKLIIEKSSKVIHLTKFELEYIAKLVGAKLYKEKIVILPLSVEPKKIAHLDENRKVFRICWWGTWIPLHGLEYVINTIRLLSEENIKLELFGISGPDGDPYIKMITELKLSKLITVHTDKSFGNGLLEDYLSKKCDLALGIFGNSQKAKNVIVNKIVDAFAMALPVLTMEAPVLNEYINTENELFVCPNNPESMTKAVRNIINNPKERIRRSKLGYQRYLETFTSEHYAQKVLSIIDEEIQKK